ncbi:MAG TPA: SDR family oxidoreductase [Gemmataceae bacterium]|nr:SDR family oxidoreductase [Gemmataceae bacterium]
MTQDHKLRTYQSALVVITGGASGIGRALGEALALRGAEVVLADRQIELAETVAAGLRGRGGRATAVEVDVTDYCALEQVVRQTAEKHGRLDYMFNNAGIGITGEACYYDIKDWEQVFDVNIRGVINGIQAAYPIMLRQGYGHIINTASMAGLMPTPALVSYCASKYAVVGVSLSLRIEAAEAGVRVSVLCPGTIRTPILEGGKYGKSLQALPPEAWEKLLNRQRPMNVDKFAAQALGAIAKNRAIIIFPRYWRIFWWLNRLSPSLALYVGKKAFGVWQRMCQEHLPATKEVVKPS